MKLIKDIAYGTDCAHKLDIYLPEKESFKVFVYFHGGALETGDKKDADVLATYLLEQGYAVVSANYRMYPTAVWPQFIDDAADVIAWVKNNIDQYGKCEGIYLGGSSAGGYLSMMLCFDKRYLEKAGVSLEQISGFVHDAGQPTAHFNVLRERGIDSRRIIIDETAPLYFIGMEESYPPMLYIVSDNDLENRYEQTMLTISTMKHFRYDMDKVRLQLMHGGHCHYVSAVDEAGVSIFGKMIGDFMKEF